MRFTPCLLWLLLPLAALAQGNPAGAGRIKDPPANPADQPKVDCVKMVIEVLKGMGEGDGPDAEQQAAGAKGLEAALRDGRVFVNSFADPAATDHGAGGPGLDHIIVNPKFMPPNETCDPCGSNFVFLLATLYHESIHLNYDTPTTLPVAPTDSEKALAKLIKAANQHRALVAEISFRNFLANNLGALAANKQKQSTKSDPMKGLPAWVATFKDCEVEELNAVIRNINFYVFGLDMHVKALESVIEKDSDIKGQKDLDKVSGSTTDGGLERWLDTTPSIKNAVGQYFLAGNPVPFVATLAGGGEVSVFALDGQVVNIEIKFLQDMILLEDSQQRPWILVAGNNASDGGAILKAMRIDLVGGRNTVVETVVLSDPSSRLTQVTSLARRGDGKIFVLENAGPSICVLLDTTGDGIPDEIGGPAAVIPNPVTFREFTDLSGVGNSLVAQRRCFVSMGTNGEHIQFFDADNDGVFETSSSYRSSQFSERVPSWVGEQVDGAQTLAVSGTDGHNFAIFSTQGQQQIPLAQGQFPAFPQTMLLLQLPQPLQQGQMLVLVDLTNNLSGAPRQVVARQPTIYNLDPLLVAERTETEVNVLGQGLELVTEVIVGGKKAELLQSSATTLTFRTSKLDIKKNERAWMIEFRLSDGTIVKPLAHISPRWERVMR